MRVPRWWQSWMPWGLTSFVLAAATICAVAVLRQSVPVSVKAMDPTDPVQVSEALTFDPFHPPRPAEGVRPAEGARPAEPARPAEAVRRAAEQAQAVAVVDGTPQPQMGAIALPAAKAPAPAPPEWSGVGSPKPAEATAKGLTGGTKTLIWGGAIGGAAAISVPVALGGGSGSSSSRSPSTP